ncbi:transglutaminase family protein [Vibrio amylolyticus]|uniref:transglutaminase-like domain-containing protein n=1 Tax=Vibrio amylolyticus TaxID=2847292 RepID=UPI00354DC085
MNTPMNQYLQATPMLDFEDQSIQELVDQRGWARKSEYDAVGEIYQFVKDSIAFGYNRDDRLPASDVLKDGYGQCNTKGTLLMALLRAVGISTRIHGFTIYNELQRGAIPDYLFVVAPERIIHSWVEIYLDEKWINLEGYILDNDYLEQIQSSFSHTKGAFSGYGISTKCLSNPNVDWTGRDTYIQSEGIADDFGTYTHPDDFYSVHGSNLSGIKKVLFRYVLRHLMNFNVSQIRKNGVTQKGVSKARVN